MCSIRLLRGDRRRHARRRPPETRPWPGRAVDPAPTASSVGGGARGLTGQQRAARLPPHGIWRVEACMVLYQDKDAREAAPLLARGEGRNR